MIKLRIQGMPEEVDKFAKSLECYYRILAKSERYKNRNSEYVRIYVEIDNVYNK